MSVIWLRAAIEIIHAIFWFTLLYVIVYGTKPFLLLTLVCFIFVPLLWLHLGGCPFSLLENKLSYEIHGDQRRNRIGFFLRDKLGIQLQAWDQMIICIGCLLLFTCIVRLLWVSVC